MKIEKYIKVNHEVDVVLRIMSDPLFTIPKLFPYVSKVQTKDNEFKANGRVVTIKYDLKGRIYTGDGKVRIVYDSNKGGGMIDIEKINGNTIKIVLQHDDSFNAFLGYFAVSSNLEKLEKRIDEDIRLERIKRKI